jgi:hypothetical protein
MERWLPVVGFEGSYEVSDLGRVRSLDRVVIRRAKTGDHPKRLSGAIMALTPHPKDPYWRVWLCRDGARSGHTVHTLVASAFLGPCPAGQEVRHADHNPSNNTIDNLSYGTRAQNRDDSRQANRLARGEKIAQHKATEQDVLDIRAGAPVSVRLSKQQLWRIKTKRNWSHV